MVQQKPIYLPFKYKIDPLVAHSQHWLEEALAEASVVRSRYVANKNKDIKSIYISNMYKWHLNLMPPGYRDWECTLYGGPDEAHRYFASQLVEVSKDPGAILPKSMTVKSLNLHDFSSVPTYWVSADKMSRIYWFFTSEGVFRSFKGLTRPLPIQAYNSAKSSKKPSLHLWVQDHLA